MRKDHCFPGSCTAGTPGHRFHLPPCRNKRPDCKKVFHASPEEIGRGLVQCIDAFEELVPADRILVISPLLLGEDVWRPDKDPAFDRQSVLTCRALREVYRSIAAGRGNCFMAASDHASASIVDEEHMNAEGHERLAKAVREKLRESVLL